MEILFFLSFFLFFPVVKRGQRLKQQNECVNLHKGKEQHSTQLKHLWLRIVYCACVCTLAVIVHSTPFFFPLAENSGTQLSNFWFVPHSFNPEDSEGCEICLSARCV